jgi:hypothetical protein
VQSSPGKGFFPFLGSFEVFTATLYFQLGTIAYSNPPQILNLHHAPIALPSLPHETPGKIRQLRLEVNTLAILIPRA